MNNEIVVLSDKLLALEDNLKEFKRIEEEYKEIKEKLYDAMLENDVKKWQMNNGTKITLVEGTEASTSIQNIFNEKKFMMEETDMYQKYCEEQEITKNGRKGYLKITLPKGE